MNLYLVNAVALISVLVGFHVAFRQELVKAWSARFRSSRSRPHSAQSHLDVGDAEGVASVLRIVGVMIMAFSFTAATFANLIVYYSSAGAG